MSKFAATRLDHYLGTSYETDAVSDESNMVRSSLRPVVIADDQAVTCGQQQADLFRKIVEARSIAQQDNWDGEGGKAISPATVDTAIGLLFTLPPNISIPEITPEATGEIAFEWYKDKRNVAVLTVDGEFIRWAAIVGTSLPPGSERFTRAIPRVALEAIRTVSNH